MHWPYVTRRAAIRRALIFAIACFACAGVYVVLALAGVGGSLGDVSWFIPVAFLGLGCLALIGAWSARRDQAREDRARQSGV
jgi:threonine/homoserine/homoserine lactone efflux protein